MVVTLDPARKGVGELPSTIAATNKHVVISSITSSLSIPADGLQTEVLQSQIPASAMLLNTAASTVVYVTGENTLRSK